MLPILVALAVLAAIVVTVVAALIAEHRQNTKK